DVRHATNYNWNTRAWAKIATTEAIVQRHAGIYRRCHMQMLALGASPDILSQYQQLRDIDLRVSTAIADKNARGHWDDTLAWFWTMDVPQDTAINDWMSEFYQVHWLRTKALHNRWEEEVQLLTCETEWSQRFF
ncbi:hypothetical protein SCLCIDRAFT_80489, partial [Scleroderma citrinum Foug A]